MPDPAEVELANYWRASRQLAGERRKEYPDLDAVEDAMSEIEAIILHTGNSNLRARCQTLLTSEQSARRIMSAP